MSQKGNRRQDLENGSVFRATHSKITVEKNGLAIIRIYFLITSIILYGVFHSQNPTGRNYCLWSSQHSMCIIAALFAAIQPKILKVRYFQKTHQQNHIYVFLVNIFWILETSDWLTQLNQSEAFKFKIWFDEYFENMSPYFRIFFHIQHESSVWMYIMVSRLIWAMSKLKKKMIKVKRLIDFWSVQNQKCDKMLLLMNRK